MNADEIRETLAAASTRAAESDETLSRDEHARWTALIERDGWGDVVTHSLYHRAVEALAWELIEQTSDTSDRGPSVETMREAYATARRLLANLRTSPGQTPPDGAA